MQKLIIFGIDEVGFRNYKAFGDGRFLESKYWNNSLNFVNRTYVPVDTLLIKDSDNLVLKTTNK